MIKLKDNKSVPSGLVTKQKNVVKKTCKTLKSHHFITFTLKRKKNSTLKTLKFKVFLQESINIDYVNQCISN